MADEQYTFAQARARLEEIVTQVRKRDISLEKSLDLLEEGVRLANVCTELSDHTEWRTVIEEREATGESASDAEDVAGSVESATDVAEAETDEESADDGNVPDA